MPVQSRPKKRFENKSHQTPGFFEKESWGGPLGVFEQPAGSGFAGKYFQSGIFILIILLLVAGTAYFWNKKDEEASQVAQVKKITNNNPWYAVRLVDGDVIYGKITDINTDPVVIESVYYNYDQKRSENDSNSKANINETADLRLVKRGNETHGPDGKLQIFRSQVVFMENLRADSKVLKVIEENEK